MKWLLLGVSMLCWGCGNDVVGPSEIGRQRVQPVPIVRGF